MNNYYVGLILNTSSFYMIGGCGALISLILGKYNLGGEGQIYVGGFVTAIFLSKISFLPSYIAIPTDRHTPATKPLRQRSRIPRTCRRPSRIFKTRSPRSPGLTATPTPPWT